MVKPRSKAAVRKLLPINQLVFVSESKVVKLPLNAISFEIVGQKTFGLTSLPEAWTLPFFGISAELFKFYESTPRNRRKLLDQWVEPISEAARLVGIAPSDEILIRSSGSGEGIGARGKFYTTAGTLADIQTPLVNCLEKLANDKDLCKEHIPVVVQKRCVPEKAKGHLSNERRCYKENRDWMGQVESSDSNTSPDYFQINLRRWREKLPQKAPESLSCSLSAHISEALNIPADWIYQKKTRVHFEWVWDGHAVFIVQADEESEWHGHNPVQEHEARNYKAIDLKPRSLRRVTAEDTSAARFAKIANVFTYLKLRLPTAPLYILDDQKAIRHLSNGKVPTNLQADISEMVKGSLVIRTDLATDDLRTRQLLPRTQEVRKTSEALRWMIQQSKTLCKVGYDGAFIFHNFIPALSAAFAYADPKAPIVQIESLWGLPEGLYYNAHDQFVVDTVKTDINAVTTDDVYKFSVRKKAYFKHFFVSTTPSGKWETLSLQQPYDWKQSLSDDGSRTIAFESRRIAQAEKHPVSIMWFIDVPPSVANRPLIPWYHEAAPATRPRETTRIKTPFDKFYVIRSVKDLDGLKNVVGVNTTAPRIRVQPVDEKLLRDRNTLKKIGEHAKATGAVIVLEGAVLSHAYYQLSSTGATVEVVHPFTGFEEHHDYNKLVRDKIPEHIRQRGESVTTAQLHDDALLMALKEKLVEEAYEMLDAKDQQSIIAELADIREVIDSLIQKLGVSEKDVAEEQAQKRQKRGAFSDGIVLVETESKPPTSKLPDVQEHLKGLQPAAMDTKEVDEAEVRRRSELLDKKTDRRKIDGKVEIKASISIPVTRSTLWEAETLEERIESAQGKSVSGSIKGMRNGNRWNIEVSVHIDEAQLEMFKD
jgi:predicted house-cleaning noncanonical NTP pyrophosphatase (MazG superfamily)